MMTTSSIPVIAYGVTNYISVAATNANWSTNMAADSSWDDNFISGTVVPITNITGLNITLNSIEL